MKKRILALCLIAVMVAASVPMTCATAETKGKVWGGWLVLRDLPAFSGNILASYPTGTVVTILGTVGSWYEVKAPDGLYGYMLAKWLTVNGGGGIPSGTTAYVTSTNGKSVRLRKGPGTTYSVIANYAPGTKCTVLSSGTYWTYIQIGSVKGYMKSEFLTTVGPKPTPDPSETYTVWVISQNGYGVNLRSGPSKGYPSIGFYSVGTKATMLSWGAVWSYIRVGTRTGYMMTEFLTETEPDPWHPIVGSPVVTSENGGNVNLRTGPGYGYKVIKSFAVGTPLTILSRGTNWYYIYIKGYYGYMASEFIAEPYPPTPSDKELTGCYLNETDDLHVGEYVYAYVTPSAAKNSVNYSWYYGNGKKINCTSSYYLLKSVDEGRTIYCIVEAVSGSGYTGSAISEKTEQILPEIPGKDIKLSMCDLSQYSNIHVGDPVIANVYPTEAAADVTYQWYYGNGKKISCKTAAYHPTTNDIGRTIYCTITAISGSGFTGTVSSEATDKILAEYDPDTELTSCELSAYSGLYTGDTITADVYPAEAAAHVDYCWYYGNGQATGCTSSSYLIPKTDATKTVYCVVTAIPGSGYKGEVRSAATEKIMAPEDPEDIDLKGCYLDQTEDLYVGDTISVSIDPTGAEGNVKYRWYYGNGKKTDCTKSYYELTDADAGRTFYCVVTAIPGSGYKGSVQSTTTGKILEKVLELAPLMLKGPEEIGEPEGYEPAEQPENNGPDDYNDPEPEQQGSDGPVQNDEEDDEEYAG